MNIFTLIDFKLLLMTLTVTKVQMISLEVILLPMLIWRDFRTTHSLTDAWRHKHNKPECSKLLWHSLIINNAKLLRTWLRKMKRKDPPVSKHSYLCSQHFSEDCFMQCVGGKRYLKSGSVPTRFSFSPAEKPKRKAPIYQSACETTKSRVKFDKVKLNSQELTEKNETTWTRTGA